MASPPLGSPQYVETLYHAVADYLWKHWSNVEKHLFNNHVAVRLQFTNTTSVPSGHWLCKRASGPMDRVKFTVASLVWGQEKILTLKHVNEWFMGHTTEMEAFPRVRVDGIQEALPQAIPRKRKTTAASADDSNGGGNCDNPPATSATPDAPPNSIVADNGQAHGDKELGVVPVSEAPLAGGTIQIDPASQEAIKRYVQHLRKRKNPDAHDTTGAKSTRTDDMDDSRHDWMARELLGGPLAEAVYNETMRELATETIDGPTTTTTITDLTVDSVKKAQKALLDVAKDKTTIKATTDKCLQKFIGACGTIINVSNLGEDEGAALKKEMTQAAASIGAACNYAIEVNDVQFAEAMATVRQLQKIATTVSEDNEKNASTTATDQVSGACTLEQLEPNPEKQNEKKKDVIATLRRVTFDSEQLRGFIQGIVNDTLTGSQNDQQGGTQQGGAQQGGAQHGGAQQGGDGAQQGGANK